MYSSAIFLYEYTLQQRLYKKLLNQSWSKCLKLFRLNTYILKNIYVMYLVKTK